MTHAVEVANLSKTFGSNKALKSVSVQIAQGEMVALIGASGSGKSTLLRHIAGLVESDRDAGSSIKVLGRTMQAGGKINADARNIRSLVGVVFQQFNLIGRLKVLTNVLIGNLGNNAKRWKGMSLAVFC
jgi:phosphonate transport system ATP-binding protein